MNAGLMLTAAMENQMVVYYTALTWWRFYLQILIFYILPLLKTDVPVIAQQNC